MFLLIALAVSTTLFIISLTVVSKITLTLSTSLTSKTIHVLLIDVLIDTLNISFVIFLTIKTQVTSTLITFSSST